MRGSDQSSSTRRAFALVLGRISAAAFVLWIFALIGLFVWGNSETGEAHVEGVEFWVREDEGDELYQRLHERGLIDSPAVMKWYVRLLSPFAQPVVRQHFLEGGLTPRQIVARLHEKGSRDVAKVTIVEGFTYWDIAERLEGAGVCSRSAFVAAATDGQLLRTLGIFAPSVEGHLFPATYDFKVDTAPDVVVATLVKQMQRRWSRLASRMKKHGDLEKLGFGDREILILASIIEKETGVAGERAKIARVFLNRLLSPEGVTRGRLQSDPTAIYGCRAATFELPSCAGFQGLATPRLLEGADNPYNTYRFAGLPPGPICNPGLLAIEAVFAPAEGDELFFVADGQGGHTFSSTYEDHKRAILTLRKMRQQ